MQGKSVIVDTLNTLLAGELAARDQYFIHSRMYEDWGLTKLYERLNHEMEEETQHADAMIKRILFLEGTPDLSKKEALSVGHDVPSMLSSDLALEYKVSGALKDAIKLCEQEQDYVTRHLLAVQLQDTEEDHARWLEQQLSLIDKIGLQNYLQSQM
jgi:bacterioferritin